MNLAVSYSVWDCEELLEASIRNIRPATSYINVVWQKYSWDNQECSKTLEPLLHRLKEQGLVDNIIFYEHQGKVKYRAAKERQKRNIGLVFQDFAVFPHMRVKDNIAYAIKSTIRKTEVKEKVVELAFVLAEQQAGSELGVKRA